MALRATLDCDLARHQISASRKDGRAWSTGSIRIVGNTSMEQHGMAK